jgi:uncharacterized protein (DUF1501 family)
MNMTRRYFIRTTGALTVYCGLSPMNPLLSNPLLDEIPAVSVQKGKTLVVIFLRGGTDGLNFIVPYAEDAYYKLRKNIAIAPAGSANGAIDLDGFFGIHPSGAAMKPLFEQGQAVALHAVGYDLNTRSHFEEQDTWETGISGNTLHSDGWLNRHLMTSQGHGPIRAVSLSDSLPRILRGNAPAFAIRGLTDLKLPDTGGADDVVSAALEHAYAAPTKDNFTEAHQLLSQAGQLTLEGVKILKKITSQPYQPGVEYPKTDLGNKLQQVARLIKANVGLEVAEVDLGGWDTHSNQGNAVGQFARQVQTLCDTVAAFSRDLNSAMDDVLVLTLSDFGRTAAENGTGGTDHGWANCMLAIGGPVLKAGNGKARNVLAKWPGLGPDQLHQKRDLLHTTDFRDVLSEVVELHLGNPNLSKILPNHEFKPVGILT